MKEPLMRFVAAIVIGLVLIAATAMIVSGAFWHTEAFSLSQPADVGRTADVADSAGGKVGVVWVGGDSAPGVVMRESQGGDNWTTATTIGTPSGEMAWLADVAYAGTQQMVAWTQGADESPRNLVRTVMQQDQGGSPQVVLDNVYGDTAPQIAADANGLHIALAAAANSGDWANADLYYGYRELGQGWSSPSILVEHDDLALITVGSIGGVWHPNIAVNPTNGTVHVVWAHQQTQRRDVQYTIWYMSGERQGGTTTWSSPMRISPSTHTYAVHPGIGVGSDGDVHFTWTLLELGAGSIPEPDAQHVYYRRLSDTSPTRLNTQPIEVNNILPTWAASSIAVEGSNVCVAWHGFYSTLGITVEDILSRCSENGGTDWQPEDNVSSSKDLLSIWPAVTLDAEGQVFVTWTEMQLEGTVFSPEGVYFRGGDVRGESQIFMPITLRNS